MSSKVAHKSPIFHHHGRRPEKEYFNASNIMQIWSGRALARASLSFFLPAARIHSISILSLLFPERETQELAHF